jgi:hypothetical protein
VLDVSEGTSDLTFATSQAQGQKINLSSEKEVSQSIMTLSTHLLVSYADLL